MVKTWPENERRASQDLRKGHHFLSWHCAHRLQEERHTNLLHGDEQDRACGEAGHAADRGAKLTLKAVLAVSGHDDEDHFQAVRHFEDLRIRSAGPNQRLGREFGRNLLFGYLSQLVFGHLAQVGLQVGQMARA